MTSSQSYPVVLCKDLRMILLSALTPMCARCMSLAPHRMSSLKRKPKYWVIDSGASVHCVSDPSLLTSVYYKHPPVLIKVADNRTLHAHAVGTAVLPLLDNRGKTHLVTLHNVIYHPNFHTNLVSVRRLWQDNNITCLFDPHNFMQDISTGVKFPISFDKQYISSHLSLVLSTRVVDDDILHARFGHSSARRLTKLATRCLGFPKLADSHTHVDPTASMLVHPADVPSILESHLPPILTLVLNLAVTCVVPFLNPLKDMFTCLMLLTHVLTPFVYTSYARSLVQKYSHAFRSSFVSSNPTSLQIPACLFAGILTTVVNS